LELGSDEKYTMKLLAISTIFALVLSLFLDREKTIVGIKKGLKMFFNILPSFLNILIAVSVFLFLVPNETIVSYLGKGTGIGGILVASLIGSVALIPGFVSYPLAAILLQQGASYSVVAAFVTTLMMVGVITLPLEINFFGKRVAIIRNALSFVGAVIIALLIGVIM
jgi:uncharacterized membrane protein YraQ (UPF0718 family)